MDETLALPSEKAAEIALRTQQLIAYETGVANVIDPLGGSWFVEELTDQLEARAEKYFEEIGNIGGVIPAIEQGYFQREIARSASNYQQKVDTKKRIVVGVNKFVKEDEQIEIPILKIDGRAGASQRQRLDVIKSSRDESKVQNVLSAIKAACSNQENLMPLTIEAAKEYATLGEIIAAMKSEFGEWQESAVF
jgi:methylmalonyl-CoA mutase N-terminal domain/subunit|tara:strand:- start:758 stop:1336 length:579 start_codon:yes stop_codon:yes gene_type:complete